MKKQFLILFAFISVLALSQVPQRFNKVIVTGDITSPKFIKTGSNADSVLLGNGSARAISAIKTDTVSLSNRINVKATGNGTANGTNTGDETLTSIKTKLGAASAVSDGYLKYQDFALLHTPTTVTASNGLSISGQNISLQNASLVQSGALTFNDYNKFNSKEPAITKNTAFNKNFGTTTGTVLEGRTFGTAANSAVGDFIQNQNSSAQSANMWISGSSKSGVVTSYGNINVNSANDANLYITNTSTNGKSWQFASEADGRLTVNNAGVLTALQLATSGAATFSSTVNSTGFLLNGNNLTSSLTTNYIPKWNGSTFVNATAGTDYQLPITLTTNGTSGAATFSGNVLNVPNYTQSTPYSYGAYSPTVTAIAGISSIGTNTSYFTNIGSIYHVSSLVGLITSVNVNETCTVQITLPSTPTTSTSISVMGVAGDAVQAYYNGSASGNTIRITFKSPVASGAGTTVKITADYY